MPHLPALWLRRKVVVMWALRKLRHLLWLAPVFLLFTWIFTYKKFDPSDGIVYRSRSASLNNIGPAYTLYATTYDYSKNNDQSMSADDSAARDIFDLKFFPWTSDDQHLSRGNQPQAARFLDSPFAAEKSFDFEYTDYFDGQPLEVPPRGTLYPDDPLKVSGDNEIPDRILQMFLDDEEVVEENTKPFASEKPFQRVSVSSISKTKAVRGDSSILDLELNNEPAPALKPKEKTEPITGRNGDQISQLSLRLETVPQNRASDINIQTVLRAATNRTDLLRVEAQTYYKTAADELANQTKKVSHAREATANHKTRSDVAAWALVLKERQQRMLKVCEDNLKVIKHGTVYDTNSIVNENYRLLYCPVEKAASTFFRRLMFALDHAVYEILKVNASSSHLEQFASLSQPGTVTFVQASNPRPVVPSPFYVPIQTALAHGFEKPKAAFRRGLDLASKELIKLIVVREPYQRLFSAYVDKLLVPNDYYWKKWGVRAITRHRAAPAAKSLQCGHDVTFPEFVRYVVAEAEKAATLPLIMANPDPHLQPATSLCWPCDVRYDVIAHVETLREDLEHLTRAVLGVGLANFSFHRLQEDVKADSALDSVRSAFDFQRPLADCISRPEMGQRLWRKLQLRGIISEELSLPLSPQEMESAAPEDFLRVIQKARDNRRSRDQDAMAKQKFLSLQEAYALVSLEDLRRFVKLFALDFDAFGYERFPSFLIEPNLL